VLLLAIDTSTTAITVALHDGATVLAEATTLDARGHAEHLAPGVARVLGDAAREARQVTDVVCGLGPGPFTGLRVGVVTARTLALAVGARLHGVCSLDALAHQAWRQGSAREGVPLVVATDARRKEVYWARYAVSPSGTARLTDPRVAAPASVADELASAVVVGRGPRLHPAALGAGALPLDVSAAYLADLVVRRLASGEPLDGREPFYLRRPDAVPTAARAERQGGG